MTNSTATLAPSTSNVPLARDPHGHPIPVPPDAAYWRVRRHTRGRPRNLSGPDRQPLKVPLDFTEEDLDNMLGAGTYRLDLCDAAGESLDVTATLELGEPEPANTNEQAEVEAPSSLPLAASDVRLVLEANVRATQMAFQHNERTLLASLRMADTLRDGIRDLANAQASWISSISSARGFFRNAPVAQLAASTDVERSNETEVDDDDDDEPDEPQRMTMIEMVQPFVATITEAVVKTVMGKKAASTAPATNGAAPAVAVPETKDKGFEIREFFDWSYADRKAKERAAAKTAAEQAPPQLDAEQATQMLIAKGKDIFERLDAPDRLRLVRLFPKLRERASDPAMQETVSKLAAMSPDDAAAWVSQNLDDLEAKLAS
jgi:hypothetical protein